MITRKNQTIDRLVERLAEICRSVEGSYIRFDVNLPELTSDNQYTYDIQVMSIDGEIFMEVAIQDREQLELVLIGK